MENKMTPKEALIRLHNQATRYFKPNDEKDQMVNKRFGQYKSIIEQALTELEETKQINEIFKNAITIKHTGIHCEEELDHSKDAFIYSIKPICEVIQNNIEGELKRQLREWVLKNAFPQELKDYKTLLSEYRELETQHEKLSESNLELMKKETKQELILLVLNNKEVDITFIKYIDSCENYNKCVSKYKQLTKTEFNLIKEWLK